MSAHSWTEANICSSYLSAGWILADGASISVTRTVILEKMELKKRFSHMTSSIQVFLTWWRYESVGGWSCKIFIMPAGLRMVTWGVGRFADAQITIVMLWPDLGMIKWEFAGRSKRLVIVLFEVIHPFWVAYTQFFIEGYYCTIPAIRPSTFDQWRVGGFR